MIFMIFCDFSLIIHDISLIIHDFNDISLIIHDTSLFYLHLRHFRFYTYVSSGFTPMSLPFLHLRHFRFDNYVTSGFTTTSLFYTYIQTHDLSKLSFFLHLFLLLGELFKTLDNFIYFFEPLRAIEIVHSQHHSVLQHHFLMTDPRKRKSYAKDAKAILEDMVNCRYRRSNDKILAAHIVPFRPYSSKELMCRSNLASYIPPSGPLGISLPSFDIRGFHLLESEIL